MDLDTTSKRTTTNKVRLSFFAEDTLRFILGGFYTNWHGYELTEREWKHILKKLLSKIEIAIKRNLSTDYLHRKKIKFKLDCMRRSINHKGNTDPEHIIALSGLCFELLGGLPDNRERKHASKEQYFDLSPMRSVHFIQSLGQKVRVIFESAWHEPFRNFYSYNDIFEKFWSDFGGKPQAFVDWYKSQYPELYAMLF